MLYPSGVQSSVAIICENNFNVFPFLSIIIIIILGAWGVQHAYYLPARINDQMWHLSLLYTGNLADE